MTKSLTAALIISLLTFLSLGPLGKTSTTSNAAGVNFFTSDGAGTYDDGDNPVFDL